MVAQIDLAYIKSRPTKAISRIISYAFFEGRPVTTRGRWINPLVFAHFAIEKRLPQMKTVDRPLFIVGTGRSGTTVLGVLLSMHREVGFLNEPKALWHAIYENEDVIGSYSRGSARFRLGADDVTDQVRKSANRLFGAYLRVVLSARLVDKYPELIFRIPFVQEIFPSAKFVFLVRNGWDSCASMAEWSAIHLVNNMAEVHDWWGVNGRKWDLMLSELVKPDPYFSDLADILPILSRNTDMAVVEWIVTMREGLSRLEGNVSNILLVRYEDLVQNQQQMLEEIASFAELGQDEKYFCYGKQKLKKVKKREEFEMHPKLRTIFDETMHRLGY